ncbi:hypothetical protein, partial [Botrimarina sp.]|uniref:hypothetical protein n=1 Tax=Botrimarina sp. TaxID=2795802 RepID=UPI0032EF3260
RQETSERYVGDFSWKPVEPSKREKSPADYEPPSGDDYEFLKLEAATAAQLAAEAAAECERLRQAIRDE